ncbi:uncharacterized protein LOC117315149 [Pecten maximus]|uniref:uncharacterized protein LOC117315149 n=1 Tax=Pecten maximus TaxID=6579 RepID=UPI0014589530|nr:uncharacterized protein LOC117315149 [Pecten maximus]
MAIPISQIPIRTKSQKTCSHHKGKELEMYCEKCQELVCLKCIASTHKIHPLCELGEITPQKKEDIKNFIVRTEQNDMVEIGKYITSADKLLKDNDSTFEKLSNQLIMQADKLKQDLDNLTAETLSLYQKMKEDNTKLIQKYKHDLEMYDKQLKQQILECKTVLQQGSNIDIFDTPCVIHSPIGVPVEPTLCTASFTHNKNPQGHLELALGNVITSGQVHTSTDQDRSVSTPGDRGQSTPHRQGSGEVTKEKLLSETTVTEEWESPCDISSLCPINNGAWSCGYSNTLALLDRKGTVIQKITHKTKINNIGLSPTTNRLWVCDSKNNIMELESGRLTHRFRTEEESKCICVTASNHIIVGMPKHICKFTTQGLITTMSTGSGQPLVCTPHRITECPVTHNIAVIDLTPEGKGGNKNKHVIVMDSDFKDLFVCSDKQFYPQDVAYDSVGNLIIGDHNNCRVVLFSGSGEFIGIIHTDIGWALAVGVERKDVMWAVFTDFSCYNVKRLQYSIEDSFDKFLL